MRSCRCCNAPVPLAPENHRGADVVPGIVYLLHYICPACTAGLCVVMWEASELDLLVDDVEPATSGARDMRKDDAA